jgi:hypothetical protein
MLPTTRPQMYYIIKHVFEIDSQSMPHYYVRLGLLSNSSTFDEVYSPSRATLFHTREQAQDWVNTYSPFAQYSEIVELEGEVKEYDQWVKEGCVRRTLACINQSMSRPYNNEPLDQVIDWWIYATENDGEIKYEHYVTWPGLGEISNHLFSIEKYHDSGDYSKTCITFQIYTSRKGKFKQFKFELSKVIDKVTYKDEDGYLVLPIFDHYLSEGGNSVYLLIHPDTDEVRIEGSENLEFSCLKEAFKYIREERYYV